MLEKQILSVLEDILIWTRASSYPAVRSVIEETFSFSRPEEKLAYELLDGKRKQGEIVKICKKSIGRECKISPASLSTWITNWEAMGLVTKKDGKNVKCFSLWYFGVDVPMEKLKNG